MGFFDAASPQDATPETRWSNGAADEVWDGWGTMLPGVVNRRLVVARSTEAVVAVTSLHAYPDGFAVTWTAVWLPPVGRRIHRADIGVWLGADRLPDELLRLGVQFADGRKATNLDVERYNPADSPVLDSDGGDGGNHQLREHHRVRPHPPDGPLRFVCEWPVFGIPESSAAVDAGLVRAAAADVIAL
ncbi:hypothetical protein [Jidongwangia harbinensis]|uniref:hypothetical protein n=1 Tax=Jidongwangia harbinensis TaxID=2878561 RepID=UPI001CDA4AD2|nr:hypothetical protein [Jidongwangia harbinensis]MCA2216552.1 hypothetical protein [Jidongwangia harbinensis]